MGSITLLLGRTRWRRLNALPAEALAGVDGFGRPSTLRVIDNPRRKERLERELLRAAGDIPTFEPRVLVLDELLDTLANRHGPGRAILPARALSLLAQRVIEQGGSRRWPWLARMGAPAVVGEALAQLHQHLAEAGVDVLGGVPHEDELRGALRALDQAIAALPGHHTRAEALSGLVSRLIEPPPALVEWLRGAHSVVFDDLVQPSALRRRLLVQLARSWAAVGSHVVFTFEMGQDLGGRAVGRFFGYDDLDDVAWPLKPFAATRELRHELFDALIAEGDGAIRVAMADGLREIEPTEVYEGEPDPDLSDLLYISGDIPLGPDPLADLDALTGGGALRVARCVDPHDELRFIARDVKRALLNGAHPAECVVALADLSARASALRAVFEDHGVPVVLAGGEPLVASPVARMLKRLAWLPLRGWPARELLDLLSSDLVTRRRKLLPERLAGWCRAANVRGGLPSTWAPAVAEHLRLRHSGEELTARLSELTEALAGLDEVCELMAPLAEAAPPEIWRDRLLQVADKLGITRRVGRCEAHPEVARVNLKTWGAAVLQLDELVADLRVVHAGPWPAAELAAQLEEALGRASFQPDQAGAARVTVLPLTELRGAHPPRLWVGGLVRGAFPANPGVPFLLPRRRQRDLIPLDPVTEARHLFCSLLRNAVHDAARAPTRLTLSWPASRDGATLAPSPLLEDLLQRSTDRHDAAGRPLSLGALLARSSHALDADEPLAASDLLRAAAGAEPWRALLPPGRRPALAHQRAVFAARGPEAPFGPYDGLLERPPELPETLAVTALEGYLRCPARYWYGRVLRLGPPEEWQPELSADRRGTAIHQILEAFLAREGMRSLAGEPRPEALAQSLHQVAREVFARVEAEGGFEAWLFRYERDRWTAGLIDERPKGVLRAWLDAELAGGEATPLAVELEFNDLKVGPVLLKGKLDRLDRVPGGLVVTDYKTGAAPSHKLVERGLMLQPLAYGEAVARRHPHEAVASCYYELRRADQLRRTSWVGDAELIDQVINRREGAARISAQRRRQLLDHAAEGAHRLARGRFHPTLAGEADANCAYCDFRRVCRVDHSRGGLQDPIRHDLQAPLPAEDSR